MEGKQFGFRCHLANFLSMIGGRNKRMAENEEFVLIETQKSIVHSTTSALDKAANRPILARIVLRFKLSHEKYHVKRIYYSWVIPSVRVHPPLFAEN